MECDLYLRVHRYRLSVALSGRELPLADGIKRAFVQSHADGLCYFFGFFHIAVSADPYRQHHRSAQMGLKRLRRVGRMRRELGMWRHYGVLFREGSVHCNVLAPGVLGARG